MANDRALPLLIIAQSARFLAQAAQQSGYRVWAADCFGDTDTLVAIERWQPLPALDALSINKLVCIVIKLSRGEPCQLLYGGGIEYFPEFIEQLPDNIQLMGNSKKTLNVINNPINFFDLLVTLKLPFPEISWLAPKHLEEWLFKPKESLGGRDISPAKSPSGNGYFQRQIKGISISALFLANTNTAKLIGINRQCLSPSPKMSFRLGGIEAPYPLSDTITSEIKNAINVITKKAGLVGLNSLDFMLSNTGKYYLLEINPRPSASAELYHLEPSLISLHLNACRQHSLPEVRRVSEARSLSYLYAEQCLTIPNDIQWPNYCHDLPPAGRKILSHQPICTLTFKSKFITDYSYQHHNALKELRLLLSL